MHMLIGAGIPIPKYYLDNSKKQQKKRLRTRHDDPLKQWKTSPIDKVALKRFEMYTEARDQMLVRTSSSLSPWIVARADHKRVARLNLIRESDCPFGLPPDRQAPRCSGSRRRFPL